MDLNGFENTTVTRMEFHSNVACNSAEVQDIFMGYGYLTLSQIIERRKYIRGTSTIVLLFEYLRANVSGCVRVANQYCWLEVHLKHGRPHRKDGPAIASYDASGFYSYAWMENGRLHREDGPAFMINNRDNWYLDGDLYRKEGPATIIYHTHNRGVDRGRPQYGYLYNSVQRNVCVVFKDGEWVETGLEENVPF
jgi:hypothetical protein